jgi:S-adenosyl-L-methionine hydrolase (adenosine-forming)
MCKITLFLAILSILSINNIVKDCIEQRKKSLSMSIITLTSDWGIRSHYIAAVKGSLLRLIPGCTIVDISHQVTAFDIMQASFILANAWKNFPEGSIHLIGISSEAGISTPHLVVEHNGHYFIGADNGIFSLLFEKAPENTFELEVIQDSDYFTFSTRDVFVKVACLIASGKPLDSMGRKYNTLNERLPFKPVISADKIIGKVIFIDDYENVFVNIDHSTFKKVSRGRKFTIGFRGHGMGIEQLVDSYSDVVPGEKLALFGSTGFLEIAINQGKASSLLGLYLNDPVSIEFTG